jgi:hypothetical protein
MPRTNYLRQTTDQLSETENGGIGNIPDPDNILRLNMYKLRNFSAPPFSDSDIRVENFLENTPKFYDIGA